MSDIVERLAAMNPWQDLDWPETRNAAIAEIERLRSAIAEEREASTALVAAWESLPGARGYSPRIVEKWLQESMKPAVDNVRAAIRQRG